MATTGHATLGGLRRVGATKARPFELNRCSLSQRRTPMDTRSHGARPLRRATAVEPHCGRMCRVSRDWLIDTPEPGRLSASATCGRCWNWRDRLLLLQLLPLDAVRLQPKSARPGCQHLCCQGWGREFESHRPLQGSPIKSTAYAGFGLVARRWRRLFSTGCCQFATKLPRLTNLWIRSGSCSGSSERWCGDCTPPSGVP